MFQKIDESEALIVTGGVYKPVSVYQGPEGGLFLQVPGGFVRAKADGSTSKHNVRLVQLHHETRILKDSFGRLCVTEGAGRKPLYIEAGPELKLIACKD